MSTKSALHLERATGRALNALVGATDSVLTFDRPARCFRDRGGRVLDNAQVVALIFERDGSVVW